jgi:hypothetical protein
MKKVGCKDQISQAYRLFFELEWKDKASYQKAFERLLRDLKAKGGESNAE